MLNNQRVIPTWTLHDSGPGRPPALIAFLAPPQAAALERHRAPWNEKGPVFSVARGWCNGNREMSRHSEGPKQNFQRNWHKKHNMHQYKPPQFSSGSSFMSNSSKFSERLAWLARAGTPKFVKEVWQGCHPESKKKPPILLIAHYNSCNY